MTPFYSDDWLTVYGGDCRAVMAEMEPESVHCVVTSPPYWGLRDYGTDGQLGLEATPEEYVANMVAVFREVRRVLRNDGTVWLNLDDSYAGSGKGGNPEGSPWSGFVGSSARETSARASKPYLGLAQKQLVGIPWRVAFALQADGWYLRSDIIWSKPNPMPESVTDRPTKSHEYLFLLSKSPRYYFDADAVREGAGDERVSLGKRPISERQAFMQDAGMHGKSDSLRDYSRTERNIRSVWTIATQPYPGAHFATFPRKLVEPCIKAGTSERGVCPECGAPWVRVVERTGEERGDFKGSTFDGGKTGARDGGDRTAPGPRFVKVATGWRPSCRCGGRDEAVSRSLRLPEMSAHAQADVQGMEGSQAVRLAPGDVAGVLLGGRDLDPIPATVLDPFGGSGTTGAVAQSLGRRAVLIDLNPDYLAQAMGRNRDIPLGLAG